MSATKAAEVALAAHGKLRGRESGVPVGFCRDQRGRLRRAATPPGHQPVSSARVPRSRPVAKGIGSKTPEPLGAGPLWNTPGLHLPAGIGHMARDMMQGKPTMTRQQAIATAVAAVKQGCAVGKFGNTTLRPATRAKACRLAAEWEAAKARARATPSA